MDKIVEIQGRLEDIIFYNEENGYTIGVLNVEEEMVVVVGTLLSCHEGRSYLLRGERRDHPKYGEQFAFSYSQEIMPVTKDGIESFLASGILKGIGPKAAKAIVDMFGAETFHVIEKNPKQLKKVSGIGEKRIDAIVEAFSKHRELAEITMYLQQIGISGNIAGKLYKVYGEETISQLKSNPYAMTGEKIGIGFLKADAIAKKMGIKEENHKRIQAGILFCLGRIHGEGHTFYPRREFCEKAGGLLNVSRDLIDEVVIEMAFEGNLHIDNLEGQDVIFSMAYYVAEQSVTKKLVRLNESFVQPIDGDVNSLIDRAQGEQNISYSQEQRNALHSSLDQGVVVITGGPGTGKTTIINGAMTIFDEEKWEVALCAPTGRAAKRLSETTGRNAVTIHRLLEYTYSETKDAMIFGKNEENPLDAKVIIVDEVSMVDLLLMDGLLKAIKPGSRLILVGDADQLPSVGPGNILSDILQSEYLFSSSLKEIFRQAQESMIVVNAHRINQGEYPFVNEKDKDFFFMGRKSEKEISETILSLCGERLPSYYETKNPLRDIQVLTPLRKGDIGSIKLNKVLQNKLNPASVGKKEKTFGEKIFRQGDKVMQVKNNYELEWTRGDDFSEGKGVFNGDIGFVAQIDEEDNIITVVFDDEKYVEYPFSNLEELELAYALTVHKSQGSEFRIVVMPMAWFPPVLANRNLLYTGVTRGKDVVVLVGSMDKMHGMIDNNQMNKRYSGLKARLKNQLNLLENR